MMGCPLAGRKSRKTVDNQRRSYKSAADKARRLVMDQGNLANEKGVSKTTTD